MKDNRRPSGGPDTGMALGQRYFAAGLRFAGGIVLFVLLGMALDRWLGISPLGVSLGTMVGTVLSSLSVYRELVTDRQLGGSPEKDSR